jgi:membrane protein
VDASAGERVVEQQATWLEVGPPPPPGADTGQAELAAAPESLKLWISNFVARVKSIPFAAIGLAGVAMLLYAGIAMVVEVERAFNQIYRVPRGRSWTRRVVNYWALLTLGPMAMFATFYIGARLNAWVELVADRGFVGDAAAAIIAALGYVSQFLISTALLLVGYQVVPNTRVRFWSSLTGAAVAAGMFEVSKYAFGQYIEFSAKESYARLYGSLALIPLFLLWVYFTWLIVLFGLQLTYQLQHGRFRTRAQPIMEFGPALVEPTSALSVMQAIARDFNQGRSPAAPAIAERTRVADPVVRTVLNRAVERGLLHRLEAPDAAGDAALEPTYTLARPPSAIALADLLTLGFELAGGAADDPVVSRLRQAQVAAAGQDTLADVLNGAGHPAEPGQSPSATAASTVAASESSPAAGLLRGGHPPVPAAGEGNGLPPREPDQPPQPPARSRADRPTT